MPGPGTRFAERCGSLMTKLRETSAEQLPTTKWGHCERVFGGALFIRMQDSFVQHERVTENTPTLTAPISPTKTGIALICQKSA
jgi:hypothetical protein